MKARLCFALLVLLGPTAFAPAPFPKPERRGQAPEITLATFQGNWRVTTMQVSRANGQHVPFRWGITHIRVRNDHWEFMAGESLVNSRSLSVDHAKKPAHLNFYDSEAKEGGVGLIRRRGAKVQVMYTWGGETQRPAAFEPPPDGLWIMTLERDK